MNRKYLICLFLATACSAPERTITYKAVLNPVYNLKKPTEKVLVLNTFDIRKMGIRAKKEDLFISLTNKLMDTISKSFLDNPANSFIVLPGFTPCNTNRDSAIKALMLQYTCNHAIAIIDFDINFDRVQTSVTKNADGSKSRGYVYYLFAFTKYAFYTPDTTYNNIVVKQVSTRPLTGNIVLSVKPDVLNHTDEAQLMVIRNGQQFLNKFFRHEVIITRSLFTGKGFEAVNAAISRNDFTAAFNESLTLTNNTDKKVATYAYYNCAVLMERNNQPEKALKYLQLSLNIYGNEMARQMKKDYE